MIDKIKMREWAYKAGSVFRWNPDLYCLMKRGFDHVTRGFFTQWKKIIQATSPELLREPSEKESRGDVLFVSPRWWSIHQGWETIIAYILRWQGFRPHFMICDNIIDTCDSYDPNQKAGEICAQCRRDITGFFKDSRLPFSRFSDWIDVASVREEARRGVDAWDIGMDLEKYSWDDFPIGSLIWVSLVRYLRRIRLTSDPHMIASSRKYLESGIISYHALNNALNSRDWKYIFAVNGSFFIEAIAGEIARRRRIDFFSYERGIKKDFILLCKNEEIGLFDLTHIFKNREPLNDAEKHEMKDYCAARKMGRQSIINYWPEVEEDKNNIIQTLHLSPDRKLYSAFPNITWDSAVINREIYFNNLWGWISTTISHIEQRPDIQLVVRVHPAEVRLRQKSSERVSDLIREHFPHLKENIKVVDADSPISTYSLVELSDKILVYTTTVGLEAAMMGKEVIASASTHYRGKGFTTDCATKEEYLKCLDEDHPIDRDAVMEEAWRYAYTLFFDTHIPFRSLSEEDQGYYHYNIKSLDNLLKGDFPEVRFFKKFPFDAPNGFLSYRTIESGR
jgi:hypothetical protein